jgi:hypothetical protein
MKRPNRRNCASSGTSQAQVVRGRYGSMEIRDARTPFPLGGTLSAVSQECFWRADQQLFPELAELAVPFRLVSISNGQQRLCPATGMHDYSVYSKRIGFEILSIRPAMSADHRADYELMLRLNQRMPQTKSHLKRQFSSITDLKIRPSGRLDQHDKNILPADLGLRADGRGRKWSIDRLLEEADKSLALPAKPSESSEQAGEFRGQLRISHGLMAAAELNPLRLSPARVRQRIRMSLLEMGKDLPPHPRQLKSLVVARLRALWNAHLSDSDSKFRDWFQGSRSNLIKAVANLQGHRGGILDREHVEWALLELTAQGLEYAASCQHQFAVAVWSTISPEFDGMDRSAFEQLYFPQRYLGGLTLPLVWERGPFLRPILTRIWSEPTNSKLRPILWKMLDYYVQMAGARRLADRQAKSRTKTTSLPCAETRQARSSSAEDSQELLEALAVGSGMHCRNNRCKIQYGGESSGDQTVVINRFCRQHGALPPVCLSLKQAREIIRKESER